MVSEFAKSYPSIFNDVIGPVMRGPSSSHCAAAVRIGLICRDLMGGEITDARIEFDPDGSLATTHESQGSDMGLFGGFLGWDATHPQLAESPRVIRETGVTIEIRINPINANHPNTYQISLSNTASQHTITAISTGGGIIEITQFDGLPISIAGDYFETIITLSSGADQLIQYLQENFQADHVLHQSNNSLQRIQVKAQKFLDSTICNEIQNRFDILSFHQISPVLPVLSQKNTSVPFITCSEMLAYNADKNLNLGELAVHYERARGGMTDDGVTAKMRDIVGIMQEGIQKGIAGTQYHDRILGYQSGRFKTQLEGGQLLDGGLLNSMILATTALMETKSSMGVIVAAPTAGACGGLPGAVIGAGSVMVCDQNEIVNAMLAGGMIGIFIAAQATFAAEVGGCQAECGAGSGMAAAALVTLAGGTTQQAVTATSIALQNILGMICDPVANRVEVPCLGKNVLAASNALACANMALADYDPVIPLDEVIETMDAVGKSLPVELRCTAKGGLSVTKTSRQIEKKLKAS